MSALWQASLDVMGQFPTQGDVQLIQSISHSPQLQKQLLFFINGLQYPILNIAN